MVSLMPIYTLNPTPKVADGTAMKTLPMGSTTFYVNAVPVAPSISKSFKLYADNIPFPARPSFLLTKAPDATTPVELVLNFDMETYAALKKLDDALLEQTTAVLKRLTSLSLEPKGGIKGAIELSDGRTISPSIAARIKGFSEYMVPGEPRVVAGVSYPGDPASWHDVPSAKNLAENATVFYLEGPRSAGGAFARYARPNRHVSPQDIKPNAMKGNAFVYVSHVWVRTVKDNTAVQYGVTYALSALYMSRRQNMMQPDNPLGATVYDPNADEDFNRQVGGDFNATTTVDNDSDQGGQERKRSRHE